MFQGCYVPVLLCSSVVMFQCCYVPMLLCSSVTMFQCYYVTVLLCYSVIMLKCHYVTVSLCYCVMLLLCHYVAVALCYCVIMLCRADRNGNGGGILIYVREDIPCREIEKKHSTERNLEGIFLELNLRKSKILLFGGYNYNKSNIHTFLGNLGKILDRHLSKFEHFLLVGDFNSEIHESSISNFCDTYNLKNIINEPTCYKNLLNPSTIDLILTNKSRSFQNTTTIETGLSDHHKMTVTVMKQYFPKQTPVLIKYRNFKTIDKFAFRQELRQNLTTLGETITYVQFENIFIRQLDKHAPMKEKYVRANNEPFMNKTLSKAIMNRSRLRNRFIKNPNETNQYNYKRQRNYVVNLLRREKKEIL